NTVLLGLALAQREILAAVRSILALMGFGIGVFVGAIIVERESKQMDWPPPVTAALALETVILAIFSVTYYLSGTVHMAVDALLPLAALLLVVVTAFIRERHQQQGSQ